MPSVRVPAWRLLPTSAIKHCSRDHSMVTTSVYSPRYSVLEGQNDEVIKRTKNAYTYTFSFAATHSATVRQTDIQKNGQNRRIVNSQHGTAPYGSTSSTYRTIHRHEKHQCRTVFPRLFDLSPYSHASWTSGRVGIAPEPMKVNSLYGRVD